MTNVISKKLTKTKVSIGANSTYGELLKLLKDYCNNDNQKHITNEPLNTNYKHIKILTDMDTDGNDILCLLLLVFSIYPQLFQHQRISRVLTPLYIAKSKNPKYKPIYYYSEQEYLENFHTLHSSYEINYIKGLGSLDSKDYKETIFNNPKELFFTLDDDSIHYLQIAFGDDRLIRKEWLKS